MKEKLEAFRKEIDALDGQLLELLKKRSMIAEEIGQLKKIHGLEALDEQRWGELLETKLEKATQLGLPHSFIEKLYTLIHDHSLEIQKKIKSA